MAKSNINYGLFIPMLVSLLLSIVFFVWNKLVGFPMNRFTINLLMFVVPVFLILASWNGIRLIKNKIVAWIAVFVFPILLVVLNQLIVGILSNWGSLGGSESLYAIALGAFLFGTIASLIALIGNIIMVVKGDD